MQELVGDAQAEEQAAGRQFRTIHRMWVLQGLAHERDRAARARCLHERGRRAGNPAPEPEKRTLLEVAEEIGPALRIPACAAVRRAEHAIVLAGSLPGVLTALEPGDIGTRQTEVIVETWPVLVSSELHPARGPRPPVAVVQEITAELLGRAPSCTAAQLPEHLRGIRGQVSITVPVLAPLDHCAPASGAVGPPRAGQPPGDKFPVDQLPGGAASGELPGGATAGGGTSWPAGRPRASGRTEPAGYGPIPLSVAARITATAPSWSQVLTHPVTGTGLEHDRTTYAVPADLSRRLHARDGTCRFPGCRRRAEACDPDHTVAWADGGTTEAGNPAHLCRAHHLLKHRAGPLGRWRVEHRGQEGVLEGTSPPGRIHVTYPQQQQHHPVLAPVRINDPLPDDRPPPQDAPAPPRGLGQPEQPPPY